MNQTQQVAVITGGTHGIGRAVAASMSAAGRTVVICSRDPDEIDSVIADFASVGQTVDGLRCDVRDDEEVTRFIDEVVARYGRIDILVNNAGRSGGAPIADMNEVLWRDVMRTNLDSVFTVTRTALTAGGMLARQYGRVINIASTGGKQGVPFGTAYSASKGGVIAFTKALGKELAKQGVTVNAVCPGYVDTPMADRVLEGYSRLLDEPIDGIRRRFEGNIPLGRYSTPDEVAGLVQYLTTPNAASITAQALNVCGGLGSY